MQVEVGNMRMTEARVMKCAWWDKWVLVKNWSKMGASMTRTVVEGVGRYEHSWHFG
jgi:hypothetical protein